MILASIDIKYSKDLFKIWSDFDVIKYTNAKILNTQEECDERVQFWVDEYTDKDIPNNLVVLLNNETIGIVGFLPLDISEYKYGFYYQFAKDYWGNGYATESAKVLIEYIYKNYPKSKLYAYTVSANISSISVLRKIGFKQTHIEQNVFDGLDLIHFEFDKIYTQENISIRE